jgi:hypothetical protein
MTAVRGLALADAGVQLVDADAHRASDGRCATSPMADNR